MNRGMRLQNYQRTFLRVNPSSSSFSSFRFLSPPSFPPFSSSRCGSVDESKQLSIYPRCATRLSTVVKGIIWREIVMWYNMFCFFFFLLLFVLLIRVGWNEFLTRIQWEVRSIPSFYFICLDYRVSRIECEKRKEMLIAIHFVIQSLSNHFR